MQQASALTSLNGKPLIVLTADEGNRRSMAIKQDRMATLSTNSLHRHADATHESLLDDEADSAAASQAIHDVVVAVRTSRPLAPRSWQLPGQILTSIPEEVCCSCWKIRFGNAKRTGSSPTTPLETAARLRDAQYDSPQARRLKQAPGPQP